MRKLTCFCFFFGLSLAHSAYGDWVNLRWNPVPLLLRGVALEADFALAKSWSVGPMAGISAVYRRDETTLQAGALGIRADYGFGSDLLAENGWYASAFFEGIPLILTQTVGTQVLRARVTVAHGGLLAGYRWRTASGFNFRLGGGLVSYRVKETLELSGGGLTAQVNLPGLTRLRQAMPMVELTLGWIF